MSRYLTPSKVTLLVVVLLYADDLVPTSKVTPFLSFILDQILPVNKVPVSTDPDAESHHALPVSTFESILVPLPSARPGRSLYDLLVKRLWKIDCYHALDAFVSNLPFLLTKPREQILRERETGEESDQLHGRILRTSPLGAFIRRCHLEYTRLQFHDSITLWQDFLSFRLATRHAYDKKNPSEPGSALDVNLTDLDINVSHSLAQLMYGRLAEDGQMQHGAFSMYDVEKLMEFQVSELQRLGGRMPEGMKAKLGQMSQSGTNMPKLGHYLTFLDAWRAGDYFSAFNNLHRYFDYAMQSRDRGFYQYALLNLAILQADFGCHTAALPAMQEAIAVARENKDTTCLNFCMSWIYHFGRSFPEAMNTKALGGILGSEAEGLAFLKSRAKDAEMWSLLSTTLISEAKRGLHHGDNLATVFENLAKASHLNIVRSTHSISGPSLLMKSAAYSRVGLTQLAWWFGHVFLQCHAKDAPMEDMLKCSCRMAGLLVQRGRHTEADQVLDQVPSPVRRILKFQSYLAFYTGLLKIKRFLHRDDLDAAERLLDRCRGQGAPDLELGFALSLLEIELSIRRGDLDQALQLVDAATQRPRFDLNDVVVQTRLLNIKARILVDSRHPLRALSLALRAAQIAYRGRVMPALWESIGLLAVVLNELGEFDAATQLLQSVMPQIFECQDCYLSARSFSILADANMGLAGHERDQSTKRKEFMGKAMENIDQAFAQFRYIEDLKGQLDMLRKKAIVMHWRGDLMLANDTASQYLELRQHYEGLKVSK